MVKAKELEGFKNTLNNLMTYRLLQHVKENGEDITDYERNEFGLDEDEQDGVTLTKVLNFYDNDGCYFPVARKILPDVSTDENTKIADELDNTFEHYAFLCLYIEIDENISPMENLKYYCLYNNGVGFKYSSEPDHGYVNNLPLEIVCKIVDVIRYTDETSNK